VPDILNLIMCGVGFSAATHPPKQL
jgi:hypothetical protein